MALIALEIQEAEGHPCEVVGHPTDRQVEDPSQEVHGERMLPQAVVHNLVALHLYRCYSLVQEMILLVQGISLARQALEAVPCCVGQAVVHSLEVALDSVHREVVRHNLEEAHSQMDDPLAPYDHQVVAPSMVADRQGEDQVAHCHVENNPVSVPQQNNAYDHHALVNHLVLQLGLLGADNYHDCQGHHVDNSPAHVVVRAAVLLAEVIAGNFHGCRDENQPIVNLMLEGLRFCCQGQDRRLDNDCSAVDHHSHLDREDCLDYFVVVCTVALLAGVHSLEARDCHSPEEAHHAHLVDSRVVPGDGHS